MNEEYLLVNKESGRWECTFLSESDEKVIGDIEDTSSELHKWMKENGVDEFYIKNVRTGALLR